MIQETVDKHLAISKMLSSGDDELFYIAVKNLWPLCDAKKALENKQITVDQAGRVMNYMISIELETILKECEEAANKCLALLNEK